jgi:hypothetical protein
MSTEAKPDETATDTAAPETAAEKAAAAVALRASRYEIIFGLLLALFAAILALNELGAGKYGDDELRLASEKTGAYLWYQSKGIKESLAEGQHDLLESLMSNDAMKPEQAAATRAHIDKLAQKVARYEKEKNEILLGSTKVGKENWAQDVDGELGKVVGVKEIEASLEVLGGAGDRYDLATLFLQLCLVIGAIGLLMKQITMKRFFLAGMIALGVSGLTFTVLAYHQVGLF